MVSKNMPLTGLPYKTVAKHRLSADEWSTFPITYPEIAVSLQSRCLIRSVHTDHIIFHHSTQDDDAPSENEPADDEEPTGTQTAPNADPATRKSERVRGKQPIRPDIPVQREPVAPLTPTAPALNPATQKKEHVRPKQVIHPDMPVRREPVMVHQIDEESEASRNIESLVVTNGEHKYHSMLSYTPTHVPQLPLVLHPAILLPTTSPNFPILMTHSLLTKTWRNSLPHSRTAHLTQ
jgi:hypothetical protein